MKARKSTLFGLAVAAAVITALVLSPALNARFVNWDDPAYLLDNDQVRSLDWHGIRNIFSSILEGNYHPLTVFSYALEYHFFGYDPFWFHLTNYILHLANVFIVFFLSLIILESPGAAFFCALAFGLHPLRVESVAWVSERKDVLMGFFYLSSLIAYARGIKADRRIPWFLFSLALFILGGLSKAMIVTLPLALLIIDRLLGHPWTRTSLAEKLPFFFLSGILAIVTFTAQRAHGALTIQALEYGWRYPLILFNNLWFYIEKTILPLRLSAFYPYPSAEKTVTVAYISRSLAGLAFLLVLLMKRAPSFSRWGGFFYLVTIFPVLRLVPVGNTPVADRYAYIPALGFLWAIMGLVIHLADNKYRWRIRKVFILVTAAVWIIFLGWGARQRTDVWQNSATLWSDVAAKYPRDFLAHFNLSRAYLEKGDYDDALEHVSTAYALKPYLTIDGRRVKDPFILYYRGLIYVRMGLKGEAERDFLEAVEAKGDYSYALMALGIVNAERGSYRRALDYFERALEYDPQNAAAHFNLGEMQFNVGDYRGAYSSYIRARDFGYRGPVDNRIDIVGRLLGTQ